MYCAWVYTYARRLHTYVCRANMYAFMLAASICLRRHMCMCTGYVHMCSAYTWAVYIHGDACVCELQCDKDVCVKGLCHRMRRHMIHTRTCDIYSATHDLWPRASTQVCAQSMTLLGGSTGRPVRIWRIHVYIYMCVRIRIRIRVCMQAERLIVTFCVSDTMLDSYICILCTHDTFIIHMQIQRQDSMSQWVQPVLRPASLLSGCMLRCHEQPASRAAHTYHDVCVGRTMGVCGW